MKIIEVNGEEIEFPDNMPDSQIEAILRREFGSKQEPEPYDFTKGMSKTDLFLSGMGKSVNDTILGLQQLLSNKSRQEIEEEQKYDSALMDSGYATGGNILGHMAQFAVPGGVLSTAGKTAGGLNMARTANALGTSANAFKAPSSITAAATAGGLYGLTQPGDKAQNTILGGLGGGIGQGVSKAVSRIASPQTSEGVKGLLDAGVELTPGQVAGGILKRSEDAARSIPIIGDSIIAAQQRANASLNRTVWDRVLNPIGKKLPDGVEEGFDAFAYVDDSLRSAYNNLLPKMKAEIDQDFLREITSLKQLAAADTLPANFQDRLDDVINKQVLGRFTDSGLASGETVKAVRSKLGQLAKTYGKSTNADERIFGSALRELQSIVDGMIRRSNPQFDDQLKAIDEGYAVMKTAMQASKTLGTDDGVFTAAQLNNAVKHADNSFDKRLFARGEALLQDLSRPAKDIMPSSVPDSGTPFRLANMAAGGGLLGLSSISPTAAVSGMTAAGLGSAAYSKPGVDLIRKLMTQRPGYAGILSLGAENASPLLKGGSIGGLLSLQ